MRSFALIRGQALYVRAMEQTPFIPAQAGIQGQWLGPRFRGDERRRDPFEMGHDLQIRPMLKALLILAVVAFAGPARAQDYPTRPIRALTTTSAGGISDIFMRALGDELLKRWRQPIVVENRPGGMQNVGARACTEAPPDGYTICILNAEPIAYNQFLLKNMPFDPEKGLQPVTNLYHLIQTLVVNSQLGVKSIDELIALSKAKSGTLSYLTASVPLALYMETLKTEKGADWVRVPFKGGGEAVNAVLSGSTPIALIGEGNVIGQIRAGAMTPLVMLNNIRSPNFPAVPRSPRPAMPGRPRAAGTGCSRPAARRSRSSTSSRARSPLYSPMRPSASVISAPAVWSRRSTRRMNSRPRSDAIARSRNRSSRLPAASRSEMRHRAPKFRSFPRKRESRAEDWVPACAGTNGDSVGWAKRSVPTTFVRATR
jgi:tripartite-type tricarboxylate transporter receptor subunit TctC